MKLRLQSNSVRLRLKRGEVDKLVEAGRVEEIITLGRGRDDVFRYVLESSDTLAEPRAILKNKEVLVQVPSGAVARWASSDEVSIEATQPVNDGELQVLVEKDFACLNGTEEQNIDTFVHPLAGTKC
jgi:hypothetical protein